MREEFAQKWLSGFLFPDSLNAVLRLYSHASIPEPPAMDWLIFTETEDESVSCYSGHKNCLF